MVTMNLKTAICISFLYKLTLIWNRRCDTENSKDHKNEPSNYLMRQNSL